MMVILMEGTDEINVGPEEVHQIVLNCVRSSFKKVKISFLKGDLSQFKTIWWTKLLLLQCVSARFLEIDYETPVLRLYISVAGL